MAKAIRRIIYLTLTLSAITGTRLAAAELLYLNSKAPLEARLEDLFCRLTPDEKLLLLRGTTMTTQPIPRLGVPALPMADAGQGVRGGERTTEGPATAFPAGVTMASTWDTNLLSRIGKAIGTEARNKGTGVLMLLGPAVNIHRSPLGGRNGEYMSEDPYLAARLAVGYIRGLQETGVAACIKHFACNNQEQDRLSINEIVGERALREIYLPAFEAGVKEGKVWTLMSSYNKINGRHASANAYLLTEVLKRGWGFDGLVVSDWGGVHETAVVQAGNDLEMPTGFFMTETKLKAAMANETVTQEAVDDSVRRILRTILRVGLLDGPMTPDAKKVNSPENRQLAYEVATKGIVLLKNENSILPLDRSRIKSIAIIGEAARNLQIGALGSPRVEPLRTVELFDGVKERAGNAIAIHYASASSFGEPVTGANVTVPGEQAKRGFRAEYFKNMSLHGTPALVRIEDEINIPDNSSPAPGIPGNDYSVRWTGTLSVPASGAYTLAFTGDDGYRVFLDEKLMIDHWVDSAMTTLTHNFNLETGKTYALRVEFYQHGGDCIARLNWHPQSQTIYGEAVAAAKNSDVAVVCVSTKGTEGEGSDRPLFALPDDQAAIIRAVAAANKKTIVVLNNGTPVAMKEWLSQVPAVIEAWFPGQEGGAALAAILFGDVNPSGKLPDTLALNRADYPEALNFPGKNQEVTYAEGIYVGYRHFDKAGLAPLFPFGHGLSYTTFEYNGIQLSKSKLQPDDTVTVSVEVKNSGQRQGEEVVQLYIHDLSPKIDKPVRELKGFTKVALEPGETKKVFFAITGRDLAYFDVPGHQWKADPGQYEIEVGASSRDLRQKSNLQLAGMFTKSIEPHVK